MLLWCFQNFIFQPVDCEKLLFDLQVDMMNDFLAANGSKHLLMYYQELDVDKDQGKCEMGNI